MHPCPAMCRSGLHLNHDQVEAVVPVECFDVFVLDGGFVIVAG
jgi:hypothetical protein